MKSKLILLTAILIAASGCSYLPADSNKTITEQAVDQTVGAEKIGVAECDELFDEMARFGENPDDSLVTRTAKRVAANKVRDRLKTKIEQDKKDKTQLAKDCRDYKAQFDMIRNEWNR
jgi:hypothetical protein